MKADGSLKTLLQGVSQQPNRDRLPGQATEQVNMSSDPVKGLTRRPGTDLVGSLGTQAVRGWGNILTPDGRKCVVKVSNTGVQVFGYNANSIPVDVEGNHSAYFSAPGTWSIVNIKDSTFLANSGVVTKMNAGVKSSYINAGPGAKTMGIVQILGGAYGKRYDIVINGSVVARHKTVDGSEASDAQYVGTTYIAEVLQWILKAPNGAAVPEGFRTGNGAEFWWDGAFRLEGNWGVGRKDDVIYIINHTDPQFNMTVTDDAGGVNAKGMTVSVPDVADLPRYAPEGYAVRVAQETDPEEDMWLTFKTDGNYPVGEGFGTTGAWYESAAPNVDIQFDASTMPKELKFNTVTQRFTLKNGAWDDRSVGSNITNPLPSFVGKGIQDMAVFQSRLVFIAGTSWIASRSKKYYNFWIGSASTLVDSDPIDVTSQAAYATVLRYAVPHNKDMVIFANSGQFVMFGRTALTPTNAALVLTTSFEADLSARPAPSGRNVFFATRFGRYTGIREFYTEGGTDINDTRPITQHIKSYLVGGPVHLSSTSNFDHLIVHTDTDRNTIYPYQFIWSDSEKVQSAWSKWTFPHPVIHSFFDSELVYLVMLVNTEYFLLRMSLDITLEVGMEYPVHCDAKFDVQNVYSAFTLPAAFLHDLDLVVVQGAGCPYPGLTAAIKNFTYNGTTGTWVVNLMESMTGGDIVVGVNSPSVYIPTMPAMKDQDGVVISNARLMINQFIVSCEDTGKIIGQKLTKWGNAEPVVYEGYSVNNIDSLVGQPGITDVVFKLPFKAKSNEGEIMLSTNEHWPMTILDIEWEGTVNKRGKRIPTGE